MSETANIELEKLKTLHSLSVRTVNVCVQHKLLDLFSIVNLYLEKGDFLSLSKCGKKSSLELKELSEFYLQNNLIQKNENKVKSEKYNNWHNLSLAKKELIKRYYVASSIKLSQRSRNIAESIFNQFNGSIANIHKYLDSQNFKYINIKNVGKNSSEELDFFFNNLFKITELIEIENDDSEVEFEIFIFDCENLFPEHFKKLKEWLYSHKKYFHKKKFPIFSFLSEVIERTNIFSQKELFIFKNYSGYFKSEHKLSLDYIANHFNISKERVRQLAWNKNLTKPFRKQINSLILSLKDKIDLNDYGIDFDSDLILINENPSFIHDQTNFTPEFRLRIFSILFEDSFTLFFESLNTKSEEKYLIRKDITEWLEIPKFLEQFSNVLNSRIDDPINMNLKGFIMNYLKKEVSWSNIERIFAVCEKLIFEEFGLIPDINGDITVEPSSKKLITSYIIEILQKNRTPLHVEEIRTQLILIDPELTKSSESVRGLLLKSNRFINTALSTYGLKEWEEQGLVIGGSIKDLVEQYLNKFDEPKHIFEIAKFVCENRETNARNIYSNLQNDPHNRFLVLGNGFVGLTTKEYPKEKLRFKGLSPAILRGFKKKYFKNEKSIIKYQDIIKEISKAFGVKEIQVVAKLQEKIDKNEFILKDDYLFLR